MVRPGRHTQDVCPRVIGRGLTLPYSLHHPAASFLPNRTTQIKRSAQVMQNETDRQGVDGVSQGERGGRVYTVRNVNTGDQTGRLMLGNTLGRNRQDARVLFTFHRL